MKVEWKKFSEEKPISGKSIWVCDPNDNMYASITGNYSCSDENFWAYMEYPDSPEKEKKWKLAEGVRPHFKKQPDGFMSVIDINGKYHPITEYLLNVILEEVTE